MLLLLLIIISHTQTELVWRSPKKVRWPRAHFPVMCRSSEGGPREVFQKQNAVFSSRRHGLELWIAPPKNTGSLWALVFFQKSLYHLLRPGVFTQARLPFLWAGSTSQETPAGKTCSFPRFDLPLNSFTPADHRKPVKTTKRRREEN